MEDSDDCEIHISDVEEEEFLNFPRNASIKKSDRCNPKKTFSCGSSPVIESSFYMTVSGEPLLSSKQLKLKLRRKPCSIRRNTFLEDVPDITEDSDENHNEGNLNAESDAPLNSLDTSENTFSLCKGAGGKSVLPKTQIIKSVHQPPNVHTKSNFTFSRLRNFSADCALTTSLQLSPRVKKTKPQHLLKENTLFSDTLSDCESSHCSAVLKNQDTRSVTPKFRKARPPYLSASSEKCISDVASAKLKKLEGICAEILKECSNTTFTNSDDLQGMSKTRKMKRDQFLKTERKSLIDHSMNLRSSPEEYFEIEECSSDSVINGTSFSCGTSRMTHLLTEDEVHISDDPNHPNSLVQLNLCQGEKTLNDNSAKRKRARRQKSKRRNTDVPFEENKSLQETGVAENGALPVRKGSDWLKSIKLFEESIPGTKTRLESYSEMKKKYMVNGLAEEAQKLAHCERSLFNIWSYEKSSEIGIDQRKYLSLKIQSFFVFNAFVITKCVILMDLSTSGNQKPLFSATVRKRSEDELKKKCFIEMCNTKESSRKHEASVCSAASERSGEKMQICVVAIKPGTWEKLKLTTNSIVRIFPPWHTLWIDCLNIHVLLCTHYTEVLSSPPAVEKTFSEKVLYSRTVSHGATSDIHNSSSLQQSHLVNDNKQSSFSSCLWESSSKNKLMESSLSAKGSIFSREITKSTKVGDIVVVKGNIVKVNEENSMTWLECDQCQNEHLLTDKIGMTYCEICHISVSRPQWKRKMDVIMQLPHMADVVLLVQIFSPTVEKIFQFTNEGQPAYRISDIVHSSVGPLVCSVISCVTTGNKVTYHLEEM